jgi:hypothetical protein
MSGLEGMVVVKRDERTDANKGNGVNGMAVYGVDHPQILYDVENPNLTLPKLPARTI